MFRSIWPPLVSNAEANSSTVESVSLSFGKMSVTYTAQNPDGTKGATKVGQWDLMAVTA